MSECAAGCLPVLFDFGREVLPFEHEIVRYDGLFLKKRYLGARRRRAPTAYADPEGTLRMRRAETFPMPPSDSAEPSAFAVGMPQTVSKNRSGLRRSRDA